MPQKLAVAGDRRDPRRLPWQTVCSVRRPASSLPFPLVPLHFGHHLLPDDDQPMDVLPLGAEDRVETLDVPDRFRPLRVDFRRVEEVDVSPFENVVLSPDLCTIPAPIYLQ